MSVISNDHLGGEIILGSGFATVGIGVIGVLGFCFFQYMKEQILKLLNNSESLHGNADGPSAWTVGPKDEKSTSV